MTPTPGERLLRFVGDKISFQLRAGGGGAQNNFRARLRTNLGRAANQPNWKAIRFSIVFISTLRHCGLALNSGLCH